MITQNIVPLNDLPLNDLVHIAENDHPRFANAIISGELETERAQTVVLQMMINSTIKNPPHSRYSKAVK